MKTFNSKLIFLLAAFALMGVGCGKSNQFASNTLSNGTTGIGTVIDSGIPASPGGSTDMGSTTGSNVVTFKPVSLTEMNSYVGIRPLNAPSNFRLAVNLTNVESGRYSGEVRISYNDTDGYHEATFTAGSGRNVKLSGLQDNNVLEAEYNTWFTISGKTVFNGVFQDQYGGIVLVVDNVVNQGDGQGGSTLSGSVYYRNFAQAYPNQSPHRKCWFIRSGPYNCRSAAFLNKTSIYPTDSYRKLGTFSGLSRSAFQ